MQTASTLPRYNLAESYRWNYDHAPEPVVHVIDREKEDVWLPGLGSLNEAGESEEEIEREAFHLGLEGGSHGRAKVADLFCEWRFKRCSAGVVLPCVSLPRALCFGCEGKQPLPEPVVMMRILLALCLGATLSADAEDWPTWRYDVERTAESPQVLPGELVLLWSRELPRPLPAFNDIRLQFDGGYERIEKGQRLF